MSSDSSSDEAGELRLEIGPTLYRVMATSSPWELGVEAIVVSVGETLGALGESLKNYLPELPWESIHYTEVTPDRPVGFPTMRSFPEPSLLVLASPHELGRYRPVTVDSVVRAAATAVKLAADRKVGSIGIPLLGTGRLRMSPELIAASVVPEIVEVLATRSGSGLREVVFFDRLDAVVDLLRAQLRAVQAKWASPASDTAQSSMVFGGSGTLNVSGSAATAPSESSIELAAGHSVDLVDPSLPISLDRDCLGMRPYVSMLATLIASRDTQEPLSVGVFGDWGSGKSYFMAMLRGEIDRLSRLGNDRYYQQIRSIGFNAWTYADANLWASLGDEVFRQLLATPVGLAEQSVGAERADRIAAEQANLQAKLTRELEQRKLLEAAAKQAKAEAGALHREVSQATADKSARVSDVIAAVLDTPTVRERLRNFVLGVDRQAVAREALLAEELAGTVAESKMLAQSTLVRNGALAAVTTAVLAVCALLAAFLTPTIKPALYTVFAGLGAVAAGATLIAQRTRAVLRLFRRVTDEVRAGIAAREQTQMKAVVTALHDAQARQQVAEAQLAEVVTRIGELGRQLVELTPGARLYSLLTERVSSDTYGKSLGLISMVRRDFGELVSLLQAHRNSPQPESAIQLPTIDRIVLYIDDLDRCTPRRVVEVLEAVHLLLALPLFVVVIGVDPRWLLRALNAHYSEVLTPESGIAAVRPEDYLEKIINVPVILPEMTPTSMLNIVQELRVDQDRRRANQSSASVSIPTGESTRTLSSAFDESDLIEPSSEVAAQGAQTVRPPRALTDQEADLLGTLGNMIDSPRDAKRLMNIYRMIRATRDLSDAADFLGDAHRPGEYEAVALLLGLTTFNARLAAEVFDAPAGQASGVRGGMLSRSSYAAWQEMVADLEPVQAGTGWRNGVVDAIAAEDVAQWMRAYRGLLAASTGVRLIELRVFQAWIAKVRRFSFIMSSS